jgi:hypothetical protein
MFMQYVIWSIPLLPVQQTLTPLDQREQGKCTCARASQENTVSGATCACGKRPSGMRKALILTRWIATLLIV